MSENEENNLRENQLAGLGSLLAGYTHELKNHLGIINESSGLMGDILDMSETVDEQTRERFQKIITTIGERVAQANTMAKFLNSLAHRMDEPVSSFLLNDLLLEELAFLARFARLKSITLKNNLHEELPAVNNNPGLVQFIVFTLIQKTITQLDSGSEILLASAVENQDIVVTMDFANAPDQPVMGKNSSKTDEALRLAMTKMNLTFKEDCPEPDQRRITMVIPSL